MATKEVKICSKCTSRRLISICDGCQNLFCQNHANAHHKELTEELNKIEEQNDRLFSSFIRHEETIDHPLFASIDVWKYENIKKITRIAEEAREKLFKTLKDEKSQTKKLFDKFKRELETTKNEDYFTEIHLTSLTEKLTKIKKQLETPLNVELVNDDGKKPIQLIRIEIEEKVSKVRASASIAGAKSSEIVTEKCKEVMEAVVEPKPIMANAPVESNENLVEIDSPKLLDPKKNRTLLLYKSTTVTSDEFSLNLLKFFGDELEIFNDFDQMKIALTNIDQATIIFYLNVEETLPLLDQCNEIVGLHSIYIRDKIPESNEKMTQISTKCGKIRGIVENELGLLSRSMASAVVIPQRPLVLLDLNDEYKTLDNEPSGQMLNRFIERNQCLTHVSQIQENVSSSLHWFVPDSEHTVIGAGYVTLSTVYHIYCSNNERQRELMQQYRIPLSVKIFPKKMLLAHITQAVMSIALDRASRTFEPDEQCSNLDIVINGCFALVNEAKEQMQEKFGVEALDML